MRVLVIGAGGREHALVWRLSQMEGNQVFAAPGNPGIAGIATCLAASTVDEYLDAANSIDAELTVVGPEAPLVAGIVDRFRAAGRLIFGPTATAAALEGSKSYSKQIMLRAGIPTARHRTVATDQDARRAVAEFGFPVVLKADGLAAGKGVVIAQSLQDVEHALPLLLPGPIVVEEFLEGDEVSFIVLSDGKNAVALQPSQDHKTVFDGDTGPNTGGMGAYCDARILLEGQCAEVMNTVIAPALGQMAEEGTPFTGFLYAGLMMTETGPKVLEFNARLGDPETQALLHRMKGSFAPVLHAAAQGDLAGCSLDWSEKPSVCVVLAAEGYPGQVRTGDVIAGIDRAESTGAVVFQAGTRSSGDHLLTAGGRVLGVTASGHNLEQAIQASYTAVKQISFPGMHYRSDIGAKGLRRWRA